MWTGEEWEEGEGGKREEEEEDNVQQFKRSEARVARALQQWREGGSGVYRDVEPLVVKTWSLYVRLLEGDMEWAVRESLGQRVWRNVHYPVVELLRKQRGSLVCVCMWVTTECGLIEWQWYSRYSISWGGRYLGRSDKQFSLLQRVG